MNRENLEVVAMLRDFNTYFSYLHGKSDTVELQMPAEAIAVWVRVYCELSPPERKQAKERVYQECSFHPTPQQFKQLIRGSEEAEALSEWINILDAVRMSADQARVKIDALSPHARKALRVVGGLSGLGNCPEASLHKSVKEDFCKAWAMIKMSSAINPLEEIEASQPQKDNRVAEQINHLTKSLSLG